MILFGFFLTCLLSVFLSVILFCRFEKPLVIIIFSPFSFGLQLYSCYNIWNCSMVIEMLFIFKNYFFCCCYYLSTLIWIIKKIIFKVNGIFFYNVQSFDITILILDIISFSSKSFFCFFWFSFFVMFHYVVIKIFDLDSYHQSLAKL